VFHYIISARCIGFPVSQMRAVDLDEMLREVLESEINRCRRKLLDTYMPIEVDRLDAQIMAYQWVQARLQDIVINNEDKDTKLNTQQVR
jgi:hypothetical protein